MTEPSGEASAAIARNTAAFRRMMGYAQDRLADEAGLPRKTIYNTERYGMAGTRTLEKLARVFGVSAATMLESDPETAEAVFLARRVDRLSERAKETFFRSVQSKGAGRDAQPAEGVAASPLREPKTVTSTLAPSDADRQFAAEQVSELFRLPQSQWELRLQQEPRFLSVACAWEMLAQGERMNRIHPGKAMDIYRLALKVIEDIAAVLPEPPHELHATVWKNIAWTLRSFGEYAEAEAALDTAEQCARACADRGSMLARVKLSRAIHLTSLERWDEALQLVTESRATFRAIEDSARYAMTFDQEANILLYRQDGATAIPILKRLMKETVDDETRARRSLNLAIAYELAGDLKSALSTLKKAQALHKSLGWTHELTKDRWALGRILAKAGAIDEALETLEQASLEFREMGDADNVVAVDLERCAIEIENECHGEATFTRLRAVASYAIEKRLPQSECRALLFLQQLGPSAKLVHIRYVKDFIADLPRHPHREFFPPELAA